MARPRVLTIAGSDPSGGAGIQADLKTFAAWRTYGQAVITVLTAQDTQCVRSVHPAPMSFVGECLDMVLTDCPPIAVKTGMLFDAGLVHEVASRLAALYRGSLVVDPVMVATSGDRLVRGEAVAALVARLLPLATLVTPNVHEAEVLSGVPIDSVESAWGAASRIAALGPRAVLLKGGHLPGPIVSDLLLFSDGQRLRFDRPRLPVVRPHGTGCTLSAAITAALAHGFELSEAVRRAGDWVHSALAGATPVGRGGTPLDHCVPVEGLVP
ncbi:MAG: bifunctional hydroxymethylpyrimidine kinase/phosphomethylpyrimidine kinase [Planctomycetes bacterium]|nr:bifunctional hydroxymethylpyrimidine kinase/phosphomethylpyrimidine kinase [Planctomycetota bacterium]